MYFTLLRIKKSNVLSTFSNIVLLIFVYLGQQAKLMKTVIVII